MRQLGGGQLLLGATSTPRQRGLRLAHRRNGRPASALTSRARTAAIETKAGTCRRAGRAAPCRPVRMSGATVRTLSHARRTRECFLRRAVSVRGPVLGLRASRPVRAVRLDPGCPHQTSEVSIVGGRRSRVSRRLGSARPVGRLTSRPHLGQGLSNGHARGLTPQSGRKFHSAPGDTSRRSRPSGSIV
jgi:hypothetical protein